MGEWERKAFEPWMIGQVVEVTRIQPESKKIEWVMVGVLGSYEVVHGATYFGFAGSPERPSTFSAETDTIKASNDPLAWAAL